MTLPTRLRYTLAAGLICLMISVQLGNWAGYAWCKMNQDLVSPAVRDCGCDVYLFSMDGTQAPAASLQQGGFKSVSIEGMPEPWISLFGQLSTTTQRGHCSLSFVYPDPFAAPLFHPPGTNC